MLERLKEERYQDIIYKVIFLFLMLYAVFSVGMGIRDGIVEGRDFQWDSAKVLALRIDPYQETLAPTGSLNQYEYIEEYDRLEANQFPSLLWLLYPMTFFSAANAKIVWTVCNLLFAVGFLWGLRKTFLEKISARGFAWCCLIFAAGTPFRNCLALGQHTLFALFFFIVAVWAAEKGYAVAAGILLSISYFKYTLIVPLVLYFIYKRWIKQLLISVVPHILLTLFSMWWLDKSLGYLILQPLKIATWLTDEGTIDLGKLFGNGTGILAVEMVVGLLFAIMILFTGKNRDEKVISVLTLMSLIITYHRFYDFVVLIIPLSLAWNMKKTNLSGILNAIIVFISYFLFSVFIHIWGLEGKEYDLLTGVLAIVYYMLLIYETGCLLKEIKQTYQRKESWSKDEKAD